MKPPLLMQRLRRVQNLLEAAHCLVSVPGDEECWQRRQSKPCSGAPWGSRSLVVLLGCASTAFGQTVSVESRGEEEMTPRGLVMGFAGPPPAFQGNLACESQGTPLQ